MLPYINKYIDIKFIELLRNTYMFFNSEYSFCLRYTFLGNKQFADYERYLETNEYHVRTIDISKNEVLFVFRLPDELYSVADLFVSGKYSYMPDLPMVKEFLMNKFCLNREHVVMKVLDRSDDLKEAMEEKYRIKIPKGQDLASLPDCDHENFEHYEEEKE